MVKMVNIPKLTLTYFNFGGRADPLRLAAVIGKVPFTNKVVEFKDWPDMKPTLPLAQVPYLEVEEPGKEKDLIVQSYAIVRYIGKLGGLYPEDLVQAMKVDSYMDTVLEIRRFIEMSIQGAKMWLVADEAWTTEEVLGIRRRIAEDKEYGLPFYLSYFENALKENGDWLVGNSITIADLQLHHLCTWFSSGSLDGIPSTLIDTYPLVKAHGERIEDIPEVKGFRAEHKEPYVDFEFTP